MDLWGLREERRGIRHQRLRNLAIQVSFPPRFVVEGVEYSIDSALVFLESVSVNGAGFFLRHLSALLQKSLDVGFFSRLRF